MSKAFGLIAILVAIYIGMSIYTQGMEHALGGVFAPIESRTEPGDPVGTHLTPTAELADAPSSSGNASGGRVRITDAVRERVNADLREGARRRGY